MASVAVRVEVREVRDLIAHEPAGGMARQIPLGVGHASEHGIERRLLGGEVFEKLYVWGHRAASL